MAGRSDFATVFQGGEKLKRFNIYLPEDCGRNMCMCVSLDYEVKQNALEVRT